ncbi:MAG TPA: hypothetical protein ENL22_01520 [candidate division Zixibacteria bacterium]|nr:hypothetical protein [candidate division Zixibacteria bacterium]
MSSENSELNDSIGQVKFILPLLVLLGILLFVMTYLGIQKSHSDSLLLLRRQGGALIESLVLSADNAIIANSFFDLLIQEKYSDLVAFLETREDFDFTSDELADFSLGYGVDAILIFDDSLKLKASGAREIFIQVETIHDLILPVVRELVEDSTNYIDLRTIAGDLPGDVSIYYLEQTSDHKHVVVLVSDALFFAEAKKNIGIGFLVQKIAREIGIEYIIFQTSEGIVFSSKKIGPIPKIENDPFLQSALRSDTTVSRHYYHADREILEISKPFSSMEYGDGIFRLGISLEKHNEIVAGFDRQMIALSIVIFIVLVLAGLYLSGKQKRKYLDRSFREVKSLSEKVFDSINSGLVIIRKDKTVELANRQFLNDFNIDERELLGRAWHDLSFKDAVPFEEFLDKYESSGEYKTEISDLSGKKYFLVNIARLYDYRNRPAGAVAVVYNYSRLKELENVANRKERLSELGDLAAGVAHEIRNPLNSISIAAQRLMAEFEPKENSREFQSFTRQIKSEAGRLNDIVTRFLSLARGQAEKKEIIDLSQTINETIQFLKLDSEKSGIVIESEIEDNISLTGSQVRVKQMIINLARNSIEACGLNGGKISISLISSENSATLSIKDNGPGIPEEIREKVFNPYFSTKESGTGLGLAIVYQIVEEFDGQIELKSPSGEGTEFIIKLPLS